MSTTEKKPKRLTQPGFSLIELLVVIAIIGLLAGILVPSFNAAKTAAKVTKTVALIKVLDTGLQQYRNETGLGRQYPPSYGDTAQIGNPYEGIPGSPGDLSGDNYIAFGAQTLVWALAGPDLAGTAGFEGDLEQLYDPATGSRRYGPYVDVTDVEIVAPNRIDLHEDIIVEIGNRGGNAYVPVFVDAFNMPVLYFVADLYPSGNDPTTIYSHYHNLPFIRGLTRDGFYSRIQDPRRTQFGGAEGVYNQDSFLLLSAGPDGSFGTRTNLAEWADNIANFPIN